MNRKIAAILAVLMINSYQIANANENTTVNEIKQDITKLNEHKDNKNYDVEQAVAKLYEKISDLEAKLEVEVDLATKDKDAKITAATSATITTPANRIAFPVGIKIAIATIASTMYTIVPV